MKEDFHIHLFFRKMALIVSVLRNTGLTGL